MTAWPASPTASDVSAISVSSTPPADYTTVPATGYGGGSVANPTGHWEGDTWVDGDYHVERKWVDKYPALFGPLACDPDEGQGDIECDDAIAKLLAKFTGFGGTFSTWTERHAFIIFSNIGYNDVTTSADVPPIPKFFLKEMAYCYTGLSMGRGAKKVEEAAPDLKTIIGIFAAGGISLTAVWKFIFPMIGIAV